MQINAANILPEFGSPIRQSFEAARETKPPEKTPAVKTETKVPVEENLGKLQDVFAESNITLKYSRDEKTKSLVVEMVDSATGEAVLQIPSEVSLKLAALFVKTQGQFVDEQK